LEKFNYKYIFYNSGEIKGRNGIVVFSKIKPLNVEYEFGCPTHNDTGRYI